MIKIKTIEKAYFNADRGEHFYEGYHFKNKTYDGWAFPYFTKDIAEQIIKDKYFTNERKIEYDEINDRYIGKIFANGELLEEQIYESEIVKTSEGKNLKCYKICSGYLAWESYSLDTIPMDRNVILITQPLNIEKDDSINIEL